MKGTLSTNVVRTDRIYDLHGLVEVTIDHDVRAAIVRGIELQIGAFRVPVDRPFGQHRRIWIGPYAARTNERPASGAEAFFHEGRGVPGERFEDPEASLAVARVDRGLAVRADYANVPINLYVQLLLAPQGYSMVHGAAYQSSSGAVNVLAGAGGIGKTSVVGYAARQRGLRYLGDDLVIVGRSGECLAFPRAFVLKAYHREEYAAAFRELNLPRWNLYGIKRFLIDNAPFISVARRILRKTGLYDQIPDLLRAQPFLAAVSPENLFGDGSILLRGQIGRIAHLDRTAGDRFDLRAIDTATLVNRLYSIIHHEWKDSFTHLVSLGAMNVVDLPAYCEQVLGALRGAVAGSETLQVSVPARARPAALFEFLDKHGFF